jgi:hypothetical protein
VANSVNEKKSDPNEIYYDHQMRSIWLDYGHDPHWKEEELIEIVNIYKAKCKKFSNSGNENTSQLDNIQVQIDWIRGIQEQIDFMNTPYY